MNTIPHSMATAVVGGGQAPGPVPRGSTTLQVQYIVAHGISSMVNGEKTLIGGAHFVFEDEGCTIPAGEQGGSMPCPPQYSHLYLCLAGQLAAVICIHDPCGPRPRTPSVRSTTAASARWS